MSVPTRPLEQAMQVDAAVSCPMFDGREPPRIRGTFSQHLIPRCEGRVRTRKRPVMEIIEPPLPVAV